MIDRLSSPWFPGFLCAFLLLQLRLGRKVLFCSNDKRPPF